MALQAFAKGKSSISVLLTIYNTIAVACIYRKRESLSNPLPTYFNWKPDPLATVTDATENLCKLSPIARGHPDISRGYHSSYLNHKRRNNHYARTTSHTSYLN